MVAPSVAVWEARPHTGQTRVSVCVPSIVAPHCGQWRSMELVPLWVRSAPGRPLEATIGYPEFAAITRGVRMNALRAENKALCCSALSPQGVPFRAPGDGREPGGRARLHLMLVAPTPLLTPPRRISPRYRGTASAAPRVAGRRRSAAAPPATG